LSDEYDFLDEDDEAQERRRQERRERAKRRKGPHQKYKEMLQDLANRKIAEIQVDLDDLATVSLATLDALESFAETAQFEDSLDEDINLVQSIEKNTKHYVELMSQAIDKLIPLPSEDVTYVLPLWPPCKFAPAACCANSSQLQE
jgi:DNA replication licensing factor MCM7